MIGILICIFDLYLDLYIDMYLDLYLDLYLDRYLSLYLDLNLDLGFDLDVDFDFKIDFEIDSASNSDSEADLDQDYDLNLSRPPPPRRWLMEVPPVSSSTFRCSLPSRPVLVVSVVAADGGCCIDRPPKRQATPTLRTKPAGNGSEKNKEGVFHPAERKQKPARGKKKAVN